MKHIATIINKEWSEVFKNRMVLFTMIFMPLIFTVLPLVMLYVTGMGMDEMNSANAADVPAEFLAVCGENLTAGECMQIYVVNQFLLLFMMLPVIIPVTIAAYSIVGEKTTHSLEPLLATPITTAELLAGKSLAAALPAIFVGWIGGVDCLWTFPVSLTSDWRQPRGHCLHRRANLAPGDFCCRSVDGHRCRQFCSVCILAGQ